MNEPLPPGTAITQGGITWVVHSTRTDIKGRVYLLQDEAGATQFCPAELIEPAHQRAMEQGFDDALPD